MFYSISYICSFLDQLCLIFDQMCDLFNQFNMRRFQLFVLDIRSVLLWALAKVLHQRNGEFLICNVDVTFSISCDSCAWY